MHQRRHLPHLRRRGQPTFDLQQQRPQTRFRLPSRLRSTGREHRVQQRLPHLSRGPRIRRRLGQRPPQPAHQRLQRRGQPHPARLDPVPPRSHPRRKMYPEMPRPRTPHAIKGHPGRHQPRQLRGQLQPTPPHPQRRARRTVVIKPPKRTPHRLVVPSLVQHKDPDLVHHKTCPKLRPRHSHPFPRVGIVPPGGGFGYS